MFRRWPAWSCPMWSNMAAGPIACRSCRGQGLRDIRAAWCHRDAVDPLQGSRRPRGHRPRRVSEGRAAAVRSSLRSPPARPAATWTLRRPGPGTLATPATRPKQHAPSCRRRERWTRPLPRSRRSSIRSWTRRHVAGGIWRTSGGPHNPSHGRARSLRSRRDGRPARGGLVFELRADVGAQRPPPCPARTWPT